MKAIVIEYVQISEYDEHKNFVMNKKVVHKTRCKNIKTAHQCLRSKRYEEWYKTKDFFYKTERAKLSDGHTLTWFYEATIGTEI